ncbi:hypothetical protein GCM10027277_23100 [Pseudoduganella ginsengisoli]|uniref:Uncharacterized protein n=1 Tax=Pseudoduganella ginsengisoli TaxID=1462440 RepID=A0A6L6Q6Z7_9BURK|nr:hypothetical protein [Pseudoduganella ginsengisoli]MTW05430.1 hypothetical protein [Pseudoduganella ginsengisoli]
MRKRYSRQSILLITALSMLSVHAFSATSPAICDQIKHAQEPSAYLVNKDGEISKGPIDFGRYGYSYRPRDTYTIPTDYKLIITPSRINVRSCSENCVELKK